ncbi:efflux transporter outer membrane subunit [Piscinibacter koreensis]|uniref:Efflux transporter outer membrane subunit n=1 Tax=Piscinibacter koreensis TaxID=2742824 RepID=A0A7Y6NJT7_9BURK|nr:efflux transporter outer membrane subunit [Schlegelella koreensis]NUZ04493.1 efflux transporter outer membrane subunit [Schlegelella koreensis]
MTCLPLDPPPASACRTGALRLIALATSLALTGCAVGPVYERPSVEVPAAYRQAPVEAGATWLPAGAPDALERGAWWRLFDDPVLTELIEQVEVSNQNVAAAAAAVEQARAIVGEQRAQLFPSIGADANLRRSGSRGSGASSTRSVDLGVSASWAPDLWGRIGSGITAAEANATATLADLGAARLAAQGDVALNYVALREADADAALLRRSIEALERTLQIVRNRYAAGVVARTDVLQAETQLATTRAELASVIAQRERLEHAIAVVVGRAPGNFAIASGDWVASAPAVPLGVPSRLLERRPDIAAAERSVAAANAQIGVARSAYFPSLSLGADLGRSASRIGDLFAASATLWSLGVSAAQVVFDAGATRARVAGAEAAREAAVARYRQTVLVAFQSVEDQLSALRTLAAQERLRREAAAAAELIETQIRNRYDAGQVSYTEVVTAQAAALNARRALLQLEADRQSATIALIQALGGGWQVAPG